MPDQVRSRQPSIEGGFLSRYGDSVEIMVVEFATHVAFLEPVTGTGFLAMPVPGTDIESGDAFSGLVWPRQAGDAPDAGFSLQRADRMCVLTRLAAAGWTLLENEACGAEEAGETSDGRRVVCLYAVRTAAEQPVLEDFHRALVALHEAADILHG